MTDEQSLAVRLADESIRIGPPQASESYLDKDKILEVALLKMSMLFIRDTVSCQKMRSLLEQLKNQELSFWGRPQTIEMWETR